MQQNDGLKYLGVYQNQKRVSIDACLTGYEPAETSGNRMRPTNRSATKVAPLLFTTATWVVEEVAIEARRFLLLLPAAYGTV